MKEPLFFPLSARTSTTGFTRATARFKATTGGSSLPATESSYWSRLNALSQVSRFIPFMAWELCSIVESGSQGKARELKDSIQQQFVKEPFALSGILFFFLGV